MAEPHQEPTDDATDTAAGRTETMHPGTAPADTTSPATTDPDVTPENADGTTPRRRGPDPVALLVGLATLVMAVFAFVGELPDLSGFDPRWLLAGGAAVVGLALLVGNLRGRRG